MGPRRKETRLRSERAGAAPAARASRPGLAAVLTLAAGLRLVELGSDVGGFHAFNEGNYLLVARNASLANLLSPTVLPGTTFLETPPLYPYLVALLARFVSPPHLAARLLSAAASLGLVLLTWLLARRRVGPGGALLAASVLAVTPVAVLTGRNAQTDSLYLVLAMGSLALGDPLREGGPGGWTWAGLLAGLALSTKLFALVLLGAWGACMLAVPACRPRGRAARLSAALLAAAPAALFYGYQAMTRPRFLLHHFGSGALTATGAPEGAAAIRDLLLEALWAFSPLVVLVLLAGLASAVLDRRRERLFVVLPLAATALFYAAVHKHSYYLLGLLPFLSVLAAEAADAWLAPSRQVVLTWAVVLTGTFASLLDLTSMKLGFSEFARLGAAHASEAASPHNDLLDANVAWNGFPVAAYYDPGATILDAERLPAGEDGRLTAPPGPRYFLTFVSSREEAAPDVELFSRTRFGLTLFGLTFAAPHRNPNFFRQGFPTIARRGPVWTFGFTPLLTYPALASVRLGGQWEVYRTAAGLELRAGAWGPDR